MINGATRVVIIRPPDKDCQGRCLVSVELGVVGRSFDIPSDCKTGIDHAGSNGSNGSRTVGHQRLLPARSGRPQLSFQ